MTFALKYRETNSRGSFVAWGIGFNYEYGPDERILDISDARRNKPLLYIDFDQHASKCPIMFIENLEKATQINALILSNNKTIDLSEILFETRLIAILESSARLARYSYDLKNGRFKRFSNHFCSDFELQRIKIKKIPTESSKDNFYAAKLKTNNGNEASATSMSIHGIMRELSECTVRDLMAAEYSNYHNCSAHNLLSASSNMAKISRILDGKFSPHRQIAKYSNKTNICGNKRKAVF